MLYIMRHGKTDWNVRHKLQGRTDIPLNEEGRKMAEKAGAEYQNVHFDVCYCSPLIRARETAEIVLKNRNVPILYDDRLKEMSFGIYEGIENSFQIPDCPVNVLFQNPSEYTGVEEGESLEDLFARTGSFLEEVAAPALKDGKDVLIVGHGAMNSSIVCQVRGIPLERFWEAGIENCRLMELGNLEEKDQEKKTLKEYRYIKLIDEPALMDAAASWFHDKWGVPKEAYLECMEAYLNGTTKYGWYLCLDKDEIIAGLGVIENDFHDRKDLAPNVCAVYTKEEYRGQKIAGRLLNMAVEDMKEKGISPLYLITDHTSFYERYGWEFLCMVQGDGEPEMSRMYIHR